MRLQKKPFGEVSGKEVAAAAVSVLINTVITYLGYRCWLSGLIRFDETFSYRIVTDLLVLILVMDIVMYLLHLLVHRTFLYGLVHKLHHFYTNPQPIDLFVLHPFETLSFGSLWVVFLLVFPANIYAVVLYLIFNVTFGMSGHMQTELFPSYWLGNRFLRCIATTTFHHQHHQNEKHNFGFYTTIWDRLFGTLAPDYVQQFTINKRNAVHK